MEFHQYIAQLGVDKAAEVFGVTTVTSRAWRDRESIPAPAKANEIIQKTHGLVTWASIYQPYFDFLASKA